MSMFVIGALLRVCNVRIFAFTRTIILDFKIPALPPSLPKDLANLQQPVPTALLWVHKECSQNVQLVRFRFGAES
jgi:hypothetical protein